MAVQWGNVAEWVGGLATAAALVFAGWQLRRDRRATERSSRLTEQSLEQTESALKLQRSRDLRDLEDRERTQASLIACEAKLQGEGAEETMLISVLNLSSLPIFDARGFIHTQTGSIMDGFGTIFPVSTLPPQGVSSSRPLRPQLVLACKVNRVPPPGQYCGVTFRDNAGLLWIKWGDGHLRRGTWEDLGLLSPTDNVLRPEDDPRLRASD